jgi:hypothetical protein
MYIILLDLIDSAKDINPYGTTAIGVLFLGCFAVIAALYKEIGKRDQRIKEEQDYNKELSEKVISLTTRVGDGLSNDKLFKERVQANLHELKEAFKLLDQLVRERKH